MDYYNDPELALFHDIIAKETCMRTCKDREVKVIVLHQVVVRLL